MRVRLVLAARTGLLAGLTVPLAGTGPCVTIARDSLAGGYTEILTTTIEDGLSAYADWAGQAFAWAVTNRPEDTSSAP